MRDLPNSLEYQEFENQLLKEAQSDSLEWLLDMQNARVISNPPDDIPDCCKPCTNHPRNGGSGVCFCTLPSQSGVVPWHNFYFDFHRCTAK